jgi:hypothetical protein
MIDILPLPITKDEELLEKFDSTLINFDKDELPPAEILQIIEKTATQLIYKRLITRGNISVLQGKNKVGKTALLSLLLPPIIDGGTYFNKIHGVYENLVNRNIVFMVDTEQGNYDAYKAGKRIYNIVKNKDSFACSKMRKYTPDERIEMVEAMLKKYGQYMAILIIDGIIDLTTSYNDEEKASIVITKLMQWSEIYDIHIQVVIHENKGKENTDATGWLGRFLYQKAEAVIQVSNTSNKSIKKVSSLMQRGVMPFEDFYFQFQGQNIVLCENSESICDVF